MKHKFNYEQVLQTPANQLKIPVIPAGKNHIQGQIKFWICSFISEFRERMHNWTGFDIQHPGKKAVKKLPKEALTTIRIIVLKIIAPFAILFKRPLQRIIHLLVSIIGEFYHFMDDFFMMGEEVLQPVSPHSNFSGSTKHGNCFTMPRLIGDAKPVNSWFQAALFPFISTGSKNQDMGSALNGFSPDKVHRKFINPGKKITTIFPWCRSFGAHHLFFNYPLQFPFKLPFTNHIAWLHPVPA